MDRRSAREHVRVARSLRDLPLIREKFGRGELSYSKVRAITRIATPEQEVELVEMARFVTAAQLERLVRGYRRAVSRESAEALHRERFLSHCWDEDGCLCMRGRLSPEDGATFLKALEAGGAAIRKHSEHVSQPVNNADVLMLLADSALANDPDVRPAGERYQVVVHVDAAALSGDGANACCGLDDGPAISAETARRLSCDASLVPMLNGPKGTLDVGRKTRAIPPSLRRALDARDQGCQARLPSTDGASGWIGIWPWRGCWRWPGRRPRLLLASERVEGTMIDLIPDLPDNVLGIEARGEVTGEDYEQVLIPAVERHLESNDKVRLLYLLGSEFDGYAMAAIWDDTKIGMEHLFSWERIAVVTDHDAYRRLVKGFGFLIPAKVKVFELAELDAAKVWISTQE